jgi:hypothetical protein
LLLCLPYETQQWTRLALLVSLKPNMVLLISVEFIKYLIFKTQSKLESFKHQILLVKFNVSS